MIIKRLDLLHYRNYEHTSLVFYPGMNVITGKNAQGKTNLLESLVFLSLTRSYRIHEDAKLIQFEHEMGRVGCVFEEDGEKQIEIVIYPHGKTLLVNHQPLKRSSDFIGLLNVVLFSPDDLHLFQDSPRERRKLINQEITKISPSYLHALSTYQNLLKDRNSLLKNKTIDEDYLDILTEQMIQETIVIVKERKVFIEHINKTIQSYYQALSNEQTHIEMQYDCCIDCETNIEENLSNLFTNNIERDKETHITNGGIHREDIHFTMNGIDLLNVASQGQKRMIMLAFKLALRNTIQQTIHREPILLLDDVLSELDNEKQERLLKLIQESGQCLLTTTEIPHSLQKLRFTQYEIQKGQITLVKEAYNE